MRVLGRIRSHPTTSEYIITNLPAVRKNAKRNQPLLLFAIWIALGVGKSRVPTEALSVKGRKRGYRPAESILQGRMINERTRGQAVRTGTALDQEVSTGLGLLAEDGAGLVV